MRGPSAPTFDGRAGSAESPISLRWLLLRGGIDGLVERDAKSWSTVLRIQEQAIYCLREVKSHRKEMGDSAEPARPSGTSER